MTRSSELERTRQGDEAIDLLRRTMKREGGDQGADDGWSSKIGEGGANSLGLALVASARDRLRRTFSMRQFVAVDPLIVEQQLDCNWREARRLHTLPSPSSQVA